MKSYDLYLLGQRPLQGAIHWFTDSTDGFVPFKSSFFSHYMRSFCSVATALVLFCSPLCLINASATSINE